MYAAVFRCSIHKESMAVIITQWFYYNSEAFQTEFSETTE